MRSSSIVKSATTKARRAVLIALGGTAFIVCGVLLERNIFQTQHRTATERLVGAYQIYDKLLLTDERRTMAAGMAAATGDEQWVARYDETTPVFDETIGAASRLAPSEARERLDADVHVSRDRAVEIERAAFAAARSGDTAAARAMLDAPIYLYHKQILAEAIGAYMDDAITAVRTEFAGVEIRSLAALSALAPLSIIGGLILWRRLDTSLKNSERAHLEAEREIRSLAMNDVLTGLANRLSIRDALRGAIKEAAAEDTKLAVLMIDLDRFKPINDRHGHLIGDLVLKEVAARMAKVVRKSELRGRYGGDEFIAVIEYDSDDEIPRRVGRRLVEILSEPMSFDGLTLDIGASVGLAVYPTDATGDDELMRKADMALYSAKEAGRGDVRPYNASMDTNIEARAELEIELREAIRTNAITPYFQPLVNLSSGRICGFEVLSRWHHPRRGLLPPADFVGLAEEAGIINDLTMAVLLKACREARQLPPDLTIAVNIAPRQIQDEWLADKIMTVLAKTKFPADRLEIELTEYALVEDLAAAKHVIASLKKEGIRVALDDFGTGFSSLSYLSELSFDKIKIDRSFIRTLHDRAESAKVVGAIIGLGRSLGVPTIAEGVETARDAAVLHAMGCTIGQGFYFARPAPAADLQSMMSLVNDRAQTRAVA